VRQIVYCPSYNRLLTTDWLPLYKGFAPIELKVSGFQVSGFKIFESRIFLIRKAIPTIAPTKAAAPATEKIIAELFATAAAALES